METEILETDIKWSSTVILKPSLKPCRVNTSHMNKKQITVYTVQEKTFCSIEVILETK